MPKRILIATDDKGTREGMYIFLKRVGATVCSTRTVEGALTELAQLPALVVLDFSLADGHGIEVLKVIREEGLKTSVAVVSSGSDAPFLGWMALYKPDAVFGKPIDFADFADWLGQKSRTARAPSMEFIPSEGMSSGMEWQNNFR